MRLFSSKKICIMIATAVLLFGGTLVGVSISMQQQTKQTFEEDGYILTMRQEEGQEMVSEQIRFGQGSTWNKVGVSSIAFSNESGDRVVVEKDNFFHYGENAMAAAKDAVIADMDSYLEGKIYCYSLPAGEMLNWNGDSFSVTDEEKEFENFIWKNSESRFLLGSPKLTLTMSGGGQVICEKGFLEMYYLDDDKKIIQLTDGDQAWQVVSAGCKITFADGIELDCETGEILRPQNDTTAEGETAAEQNALYQTLNLQNLDIDSEENLVLGIKESQPAPSFRFSITDGEDGSDGEAGEAGEAGEDGEDGEDGDDGEDGKKGEAGSGGAVGTTGGSDLTVENGRVETGVEIKVGQPTIKISDGSWNINTTNPSFSLEYETDSYESIDPTDGQAYVYLYEVKTGTIIQEWTKDSSGDPLTLRDTPTVFNISKPLQMGTTYGLAVVDTYGLNGTNYTTKLLDRIFTTDELGISVSLIEEAADSFRVSILGDSYATVQKVEAVLKEVHSNEIREEYTGSFDNLIIGKASGTGLKSNTFYNVELKVTSEAKGVPVENTYQFQWKTLKAEPVIGGISMRSENGYLIARIQGNHDGARYGEVVDTDQALEKVTYYLYNKNRLTEAYKSFGPLAKEVVTNTGDAYFKVDGETIKHEGTYYVLAEYTWNDGTKTITVPVEETKDGGVTDDVGGVTSNETTTISGGIALGRAFAYTQAVYIAGANMSYTGNGTKLYNLSNKADPSEGTTYESIAGALTVNLSGMVVNVSELQKLDLVVTDNLTYEKTFSFDNCEGKQGDIEGTFSLPLDIDGLLISNTYAMILKGYVYNQSTNTYKYSTIGTITVRTDLDANIAMGIEPIKTESVGVKFWLGDSDINRARGLKNYYDQKNGEYEDTAAYFNNTDASYRNLSSIVFELYKGATLEGNDPAPADLLGICEVYCEDLSGNRASFVPGYSPMYQKFYGDAISVLENTNSRENTVGVGDSFHYRFEYNTATTQKTGVIPETAIQDMSADGKYTIRVKTCYDYTYDRYNFSTSGDLYNYYKISAGLEMEDYVNQLSINGGVQKVQASISFTERPLAPTDEKSVVRESYGLAVYELSNESMGAYNGDNTQNNLFDPALLEDTAVGLRIQSYYNDTGKKKTPVKSATYYGTTYEKYSKEWEQEETLDDVKDKTCSTSGEDVIDFIFTFDMSGRYTMPQVYVLPTPKGMTKPSGYLDPNPEDRGYDFRKYDNNLDAWIVYANPDFLQRGKTFVFAYDAKMQFAIGEKEEFLYPSDYYANGWIAGKRYQKDTILRSKYTMFNRQIPQVSYWVKSAGDADTNPNNRYATGGEVTFQVYLNDPDGAVLPESLLGYNEGYNVVGGIYSTDDNMLTDIQSELFKQPIRVNYKTGANENSLTYHTNTDDNSILKGMVEGIVLQNSTSVLSREDAVASLETLITAMKKVETGVKVDAGTEITFDSLNPDGVYYSWKAAYRLLDDYRSTQAVGSIPLIEYKFSGIDNWTSSGSAFTSQQGDASGNTYNIVTTVDDASQNLVFVDVQYQSGTSWNTYVSAMSRIAGVEVTAAKVNAGSTLETIKDESHHPIKVLSQFYRRPGETYYSFQFNISDFNVNEGSIGEGTQLVFNYKFYYNPGVSVSGDDVQEDEYYTLKSVNGITGGQSTPSNAYLTFTNESMHSSMTANADARRSMYMLGDSAVSRKPHEILLSAVKANSGTYYATDVKQQYYVKELPFSYDANLNGDFLREESLTEGADADSAYSRSQVAEICKLATIEHTTTSYTLGRIAPTLENFKAEAAATQAKAEILIANHNLMPYPEISPGNNENLHLYYAVYKETTVEEDGEEVKKLELAGVMIGEPKVKPAGAAQEVEQTEKERIVTFEGLEKEAKYRIYIYYKDNRKGDAKPDTDAALFGSQVKKGIFVTGNEASTYAEVFTPKKDGVLDPASNEAKGSFAKISGCSEHIVEAEYRDPSGNLVAAVKDYYEVFSTKAGLPITGLSLNLGNTSPYIAAGAADSGKEIKLDATVSFIQNENTKLFFVVERCETSKNATVEENWKTILWDKNHPKGENNALINCAGMDMAWGIYENGTFQKHIDGYTGVTLTETLEGSYTATLTMKYYPDKMIIPGYYYRAKAMVFQYDKEGENPELISIDSSDDEKQYKISPVRTWAAYQYSTLSKPVRVVVNSRDSQNIYVSVNAQNNGTYPDGNYYLRLAELQPGGTWKILEGPNAEKYYAEVSGSDNTRWDQKTLRVGATYRVHFKELKPNTTYSIRFYGLNDTEYNNYVNIFDHGIPLEKDDKPMSILSISNGAVTSNLDALYKRYFGSGAVSDNAGSLNIAADGGENDGGQEQIDASNVFLCSSNDIKTFADTQSATIGTCYQQEIHADAKMFKLYFTEAAGLGGIQTIEYEIVRFGSADSVFGTLTKEGTSIMDNDATYGDVSLSIINNNLEFQSGYIYTIQLHLYDAHGVKVEVPEPITVTFK